MGCCISDGACNYTSYQEEKELSKNVLAEVGSEEHSPAAAPKDRSRAREDAFAPLDETS